MMSVVITDLNEIKFLPALPEQVQYRYDVTDVRVIETVTKVNIYPTRRW
jgi:hypothetical protein